MAGQVVLTVIVNLLSGVLMTPLKFSDMAPRVYAGEEVNIEDHPYYAYLGGCGGSIISDRWILTAAHCLPVHSVIVGCDTKPCKYYAKKYKVKQQIVHKYRLVNDIALLELVTPLEFNSKVQSINLTNANDYDENSLATVVGFGNKNDSKDLGYTPTKRLLSGDVKILFIDSCQTYLDKLIDKPDDIMNLSTTDNKVVCAVPRNGKKKQCACEGDSGGPLVSNGKLVGITWYRYTGIIDQSCNPIYPGVFTRVSSYRKWINKYTGL